MRNFIVKYIFVDLFLNWTRTIFKWCYLFRKYSSKISLFANCVVKWWCCFFYYVIKNMNNTLCSKVWYHFINKWQSINPCKSKLMLLKPSTNLIKLWIYIVCVCHIKIYSCYVSSAVASMEWFIGEILSVGVRDVC